jgi:hypothetical protein
MAKKKQKHSTTIFSVTIHNLNIGFKANIDYKILRSHIISPKTRVFLKLDEFPSANWECDHWG